MYTQHKPAPSGFFCAHSSRPNRQNTSATPLAHGMVWGRLFRTLMARITKEINGNYALEGLSLKDNRPTLHKDELSDITVVFDWSRVIGSETIASVTNTADGATIDSETNDTTTSEFDVSGKPRANATVLTSVTLTDGQTLVERLNVIERDL